MKWLVGVPLIALLASFASATPFAKRDLAAICKQPRYEPILCTLSSSYSNQVAAFCTKNLPVQTATSATTTLLRIVSHVTPAVTHKTTTVTRTSTSTVTSTTVTLLPTTVTTSTITQITTSVTVTTPPTVTVTTTVWTTAGMKKREIVEKRSPLPERGNIPLAALFAALPKDVVAQVCECFNVPNPTTTKVKVVTSTTIIYTSSTITVTDTVSTVIPTQTTRVVVATSYNPVTAVTTFVSVVNPVSTAPTPTSTVTVSKALAPQCLGILANNKIFRTINPGGRQITDIGQYVALPSNELGFDTCCSLCYLNVPDCAAYSMSNQGVPGQALCQIFKFPNPLSTGVTAQCPGGVVADGQSSVKQPGSIGYGPGPCFGNYVVT